MAEFVAMRRTEVLTFSSMRARNPAEDHSLTMSKVLGKIRPWLTLVNSGFLNISPIGVLVPKLGDLGPLDPQE